MAIKCSPNWNYQASIDKIRLSRQGQILVTMRLIE